MRFTLKSKNGGLLKTGGKFVAEDIEVRFKQRDLDSLVSKNILENVTILDVEGGIPYYKGETEGISIVRDTIQMNIERQKYSDYVYYQTTGINKVLTYEEYLKKELLCQQYYSKIMGV